MAVDVSTEITIDRPRGEVAAYAADPENVPEWYVNIKSVEWQTKPPLEVGSRIAFVAHFLGMRMAYTYEVAVHEPGERLVMKTSEGPFPMQTHYSWRDTDDGGTHMTLRNAGSPTGFSGLFAPVMAMMMRRANTNDLKLLKRILESR